MKNKNKIAVGDTVVLRSEGTTRMSVAVIIPPSKDKLSADCEKRERAECIYFDASLTLKSVRIPTACLDLIQD